MPLRFAILNDLHINSASDPDASVRKFQLALAQILSGVLHPRPDLLVLAGDLVQDATEENLALLRDILKPVADLPVLVSPGNHDNDPQRPDEGWGPLANALTATVAMPVGMLCTPELDLIAVDNALGDSPDDTTLGERNAQVEALLAGRPGKAKLLITHIPLFSPREAGPLIDSFGYPTWQPLEQPNRLAVMARHHMEHGDLLAVVSGHLHLSGTVRDGAVCQVVSAGVLSWPHDYLWGVIANGRLQLTHLSIEREPDWIDFGAAPMHNGVHDRRGVQNMHDSGHRSPGEYLCGRPDERITNIEHQPSALTFSAPPKARPA